jgi:hypothetical protein
MKKNVLILACLVFMSGCSFLSWPTPNPPPKPQEIYGWTEVQTSSPKVVVTENDKSYVVNETKKEVIVNYAQKRERLTFMQRLGNWISNLGMLGLIAIVIGLFVAPVATIGFLTKNVSKLKKAMKETVNGIGQINGNSKEEIKSVLSKTQSTSTKKIVDDLKRED